MNFLEIVKPFCKERYYLNDAGASAGKRLSFYAFFDSEYSPKFRYSRNGVGRFYNLFYVLSGQYELAGRGKRKEILPAGTFVIDNMDDPHCQIGNGGGDLCCRKCILLLKDDFSRQFISLFFPEGKARIRIREEDREQLLILLERLRERFSPGHKELDISGATGDLAELFDFLNSRQERRDSGPLLDRILSYIGSRLFDPSLQREEISSFVAISPSSLDRLFRKHIRKSVNEYIAEKRLLHVTRLLALPLLRSKEIAASSGFSSTIYMDRLFRKKYGMTPTQYRKKLAASASSPGKV